MSIDQIYDEARYKQLLSQAQSSSDESTHRQIDVDVPRTFSWHPYFDSNKTDVGAKKLKNCLYAFSEYNCKYTQGMNYVMAFILMVSGGNETEAFWFFVALTDGTDDFRPGIAQFYTDGFPLYYQYIEQFEQMFEEKLPSLKQHFDDIDYSGPIWLQKWFITVFLYSFPLAL